MQLEAIIRIFKLSKVSFPLVSCLSTSQIIYWEKFQGKKYYAFFRRKNVEDHKSQIDISTAAQLVSYQNILLDRIWAVKKAILFFRKKNPFIPFHPSCQSLKVKYSSVLSANKPCCLSCHSISQSLIITWIFWIWWTCVWIKICSCYTTTTTSCCFTSKGISDWKSRRESVFSLDVFVWSKPFHSHARKFPFSKKKLSL